MSFFDQIIGKIFKNQQSSSPLHHKEILQRSDKELNKYNSWIQTKRHHQIIEAVSQAYFYKKTQIISPIEVHLFQSQGADGFAIKYDQTIGKENFQHLFDYFKNQVLNFGYKLQASERNFKDKGSHIEIIQKYYLKPALKTLTKIDSSIINQQYGNILIEHISLDKSPGYLKFLVTFYQDRLFTVVKDYDELINRLFKL